MNPGLKMRLGLLLRQAHQRAAHGLNTALEPLGLTGRHFGVLLLLDRDGTSTQRDLIAQTGSDKAGMVRTVDDLEKRGYLQRTTSSTDRRITNLTLTSEGQEVFRTARRLAARVSDDLFASFTATEVETLDSLLARFVDDGRPDR